SSLFPKGEHDQILRVRQFQVLEKFPVQAGQGTRCRVKRKAQLLVQREPVLVGALGHGHPSSRSVLCAHATLPDFNCEQSGCSQTFWPIMTPAPPGAGVTGGPRSQRKRSHWARGRSARLLTASTYGL